MNRMIFYILVLNLQIKYLIVKSTSLFRLTTFRVLSVHMGSGYLCDNAALGISLCMYSVYGVCVQKHTHERKRD